jgi:hypothetical protein
LQGSAGNKCGDEAHRGGIDRSKREAKGIKIIVKSR